MFRTVLDVDFTSKYSRFRPLDKEHIERMVIKISKCTFFIKGYSKPSSHKGIHFILFCSVKCDICRLCYDDDKHFAYDMNRPEYARNILFDKKEKIKIG